MTTSSDESGRRLATRYPTAIEVELKLKGGAKMATTGDVSRHGLFVRMTDPPPLNHVILLTVQLPDAPFETMATVAWADEDPDRDGGAGLKLFCLASEAKGRWDTFIQTVSGKSYSLAPRPAARADSVSFIVQLASLDEIEEFVNKHVRPRGIVEVTPALKDVGAEILCVLVHPETEGEFILVAKVEELYPDRPHKMGIRFFPLDMAQRKRFRTFIGVDERARKSKEPQVPTVPLVRARRQAFTEYAFFSTKVKDVASPDASADPSSAPNVEEPEVIEGDLLAAPELELVDKDELFDFSWFNQE